MILIMHYKYYYFLCNWLRLKLIETVRLGDAGTGRDLELSTNDGRGECCHHSITIERQRNFFTTWTHGRAEFLSALGLVRFYWIGGSERFLTGLLL